MATKTITPKNWVLTPFYGRYYSDNQDPLPTPGAGEALLTYAAVVGAVGYRIYYDQTNPVNTLTFDQAAGAGIDAGDVLFKLISGLAPGTWYFAVTAYDAHGFETDYSTIVSKVVT